MALGDPAAQDDPFLQWFYGTQQQQAAADPLADIYMQGPRGADPLALAEYGLVTPGLSLPPPPPPPPTQKIGLPIEETAGPTPAAAPVPVIGEPRPPSVENVLGEMASYSLDAPPPFSGEGIPPAPDAVSEAGPIASMLPPGASVGDILGAPAAEPSAPPELEMPADPITTEQRAAQLARDPLGLALAEGDLEARRGEHGGDQLQVAQNRDEFSRERNEQMRRDAFVQYKADVEKLNGEWQQLANAKVDPNRWWSSRSTGQKIAGYISAIVGGLVAGRTGGPNTGLAMIQKAIDDDIDAQKTGLHTKQQGLYARKGVLADQFALSGDEFRAAETVRVASYERAKQEIATEMQKYDPAGTAAVRLAKLYRDLDAAQQQAIAARDKQMLEATEKALEIDGKRIDNATKLRKLAGSGIGAGGSKLPPAHFAQQNLPAPPVPMTEKEYTTWLERTKKGQEIAAGSSTLPKEQKENEVFLPGGKTFIARGTGESVEKLRDKVAATETVIHLMDEALRIRTGWTSDTAKSAEWQQLKANWAAAQGVAKDVLGLGALSGPDMDLVNKFIGTDDPTQFRDPEPGILKARENLIRLSNSATKNRGAPEWNIPRIKGEPPKASESDRKFQHAQTAPSNTQAIEHFKQAGIPFDVGAGTADVRKAAHKTLVLDGEDEADRDNWVLPDTRKYITELGAMAGAKDKAKRDAARAALNKLVDTGGNQGIKKAALRELVKLPDVDLGPARKYLEKSLDPTPLPTGGIGLEDGE